MIRSQLFRSLVIGTSLASVLTLAVTNPGRSQCPVDPDKLHLALFEKDLEVGRVYRDRAGSEYVEHWVLYPGYSFDRAQRSGAAMQIELVEGGRYESVDDFLKNVPFPKGSRYVVAVCQEFDSLPVDR